MDVDFSNVTLSSTFDDSSEKYTPSAWDFLIQISVILGMTTDSFLIYVITVFKTLHTKRNILILNWIISDLICLTFHTINLETIAWLVHGGYSHHIAYCIFYKMDNLFQNITIVFINILFIEYFYNKITLRTIPFIWIVNLIFVVSVFTGCFLYHNTEFFHMTLFLNFSVLLISSIFKSCLYLYRWIRRVEQKMEVRNVITATYISCWISGFIISFCTDFIHYQYFAHVNFIYGIIGILSNCTSILLAIILTVLDNEFRYLISKTLTCNKGNVFSDISFNRAEAETPNYHLFASAEVTPSENI